jgi:hypothetical protein
MATKTCSECNWLRTEEGYPFYCLVSDYITTRKSNDRACDEFLLAGDELLTKRQQLNGGTE